MLQGPPKPGEVVIHVCDEARGVERDFVCGRRQLVSGMRYFEKYLGPAHPTSSSLEGSSLKHSDGAHHNRIVGDPSLPDDDDEVDISVHCDVVVFEWLMNFVKNQSPRLSVSNVISILISSDFLQMSGLVSLCLRFTADHLSSVIKLPLDLSCLSTTLMRGLADQFSDLSQLEMVDDPSDKILSDLYRCKLTDLICQAAYTPGESISSEMIKKTSIISSSHNSSSVVSDSITSPNKKSSIIKNNGGNNKKLPTQTSVFLDLCLHCGLLMTTKTEICTICRYAPPFVGFHGSVSQKHSGLLARLNCRPKWDFEKYFLAQRMDGHKWKAIAWHIWSLMQPPLWCLRCQSWFHLTHLQHCTSHMKSASISEDRMHYDYQCCRFRRKIFDLTQHTHNHHSHSHNSITVGKPPTINTRPIAIPEESSTLDNQNNNNNNDEMNENKDDINEPSKKEEINKRSSIDWTKKNLNHHSNNQDIRGCIATDHEVDLNDDHTRQIIQMALKHAEFCLIPFEECWVCCTKCTQSSSHLSSTAFKSGAGKTSKSKSNSHMKRRSKQSDHCAASSSTSSTSTSSSSSNSGGIVTSNSTSNAMSDAVSSKIRPVWHREYYRFGASQSVLLTSSVFTSMGKRSTLDFSEYSLIPRRRKIAALNRGRGLSSLQSDDEQLSYLLFEELAEAIANDDDDYEGDEGDSIIHSIGNRNHNIDHHSKQDPNMSSSMIHPEWKPPDETEYELSSQSDSETEKLSDGELMKMMSLRMTLLNQDDEVHNSEDDSADDETNNHQHSMQGRSHGSRSHHHTSSSSTTTCNSIGKRSKSKKKLSKRVSAFEIRMKDSDQMHNLAKSLAQHQSAVADKSSDKAAYSSSSGKR